MSGHNPTSPVMRPADEDDVLDTSEVPKAEKMFALKKWNAVAMWSWDVECDVCAICRIQVMGRLNLHPLSDNLFNREHVAMRETM